MNKENFVITIGRQFGSGGRDVGKLLSEKLAIGFYDKKLIAEAEKISGLSGDTLRKTDEKTPGSLLHALSLSFGFGGFSEESIFKIQSDAIRSIAEKESCVIVGRCADYVLRDNPDCLNIFIHAPKSIRIENVSRRLNITQKEACCLIEKTDKSRAAYYNFYTSKQWGESASYHISIDSSLVGIVQTASYLYGIITESEYFKNRQL